MTGADWHIMGIPLQGCVDCEDAVYNAVQILTDLLADSNLRAEEVSDVWSLKIHANRLVLYLEGRYVGAFYFEESPDASSGYTASSGRSYHCHTSISLGTSHLFFYT